MPYFIQICIARSHSFSWGSYQLISTEASPELIFKHNVSITWIGIWIEINIARDVFQSVRWIGAIKC